MNLPKRSSQHKVETESVALLRTQLGSDWVFRDHQDRDYGVDVHLELFDGEVPTGLVLYGQVKGTLDPFGQEVTLSGFPTKTANYANLFGIPFFVFFTSTASKETKFVWLQEYLLFNIKSSQLSEQESISIKFPTENTLTKGGNRKIKAILERHKLNAAALKFITHYERLINQIELMRSGNDKAIQSCITQIREMKNLSLVLQRTDERDLFACDFNEAIGLLKFIKHEKSTTKTHIIKLENLILPLKMKKMDLLNLDTQDAIANWLTGQKHY